MDTKTMTTVPASRVYVGTSHLTRGQFMIGGHEFGPVLVGVRCSEDEFIDELGPLVGSVLGEDELRDWYSEPGESIETTVERLIYSGQARYTDGGDLVSVSDYEWMRVFDSMADLRAFMKKRGLKF